MKKERQSALAMKLKRERKELDLVDQKLLSLLNQRLRIALECGNIKTEMGKKISDPRREAEVLRKLRMENRGPLRKKDLEKVFRTIIKVCRSSQKGVNPSTPRP